MTAPRQLAVMLGPDHAADWKAAFTRTLAEWSVFLDAPAADGEQSIEVNAARDHYGFARLLEVAEAAARFPGAAFLDYRSPCPFLAGHRPIGVVEWLELEPHRRGDWLPAIIKVGRGLIVAPARGVSRPAVAKLAFRLDNVCSKFGFDDGDALLTRDLGELHDYRARTGDAIDRRLAELGYDRHVGAPVDTIHNAYRLDASERERGRLARHTVTIWAYDFSIADDVALFG